MNDRPNVLLISVDHWPANLLGCAGHPAIRTPTLDQLAANGVRFSNCYSECPVCVPARRTLMTGLTPNTHGGKHNDGQEMPDVPTLAQSFRDQGYQAFAVGKLHVSPQRDRIGFDDVILDEEGRGSAGVIQDDYELFLGDHGHAGQRFAGGMTNNEYVHRPWHLDESLHVTHWAATQMSRTIQRKDPTRPAFWYLSFSHPHPPLAPLQAYLDMYRDVEIPPPHIGDWAKLDEHTPTRVAARILGSARWAESEIPDIRRAFYALCTHIDHQIRRVVGTLRDSGQLQNTIIAFMSDHGDMLGNHNQWAKDQMNDDSNNVPMIICGQPIVDRIGHHVTSHRLVGLADVMPSLLDLADLDTPAHVEGKSMFDDSPRELAYSLFSTGDQATRMVRDKRYKLIWFARGSQHLLFDMQDDPDEMHNRAGDATLTEIEASLFEALIANLDDEDRSTFMDGDTLRGLPAGEAPEPSPNWTLSLQRGSHWPPPPVR